MLERRPKIRLFNALWFTGDVLKRKQRLLLFPPCCLTADKKIQTIPKREWKIWKALKHYILNHVELILCYFCSINICKCGKLWFVGWSKRFIKMYIYLTSTKCSRNIFLEKLIIWMVNILFFLSSVQIQLCSKQSHKYGYVHIAKWCFVPLITKFFTCEICLMHNANSMLNSNCE